ncbi:hypothetical protein Tco_0474835 [Tanacetum coccineum]
MLHPISQRSPRVFGLAILKDCNLVLSLCRFTKVVYRNRYRGTNTGYEQEAYIKEVLGCSLLDYSLILSRSVVIADETYKNILNHDFKITLSRSRPAFKEVNI